jgi:AcrR family transcriptional regulator
MTSHYHHGDLPNALRDAAAEVIAEKGLGGFSLREVARRADVSHTAPAHHFGDMTGLLTSLATAGFAALCAAETAAISAHGGASDRLAAIGRAYVQLADENPGYCEVMFRVDVVDTTNAALRQAGMQSYEVLSRVVEELIAEESLTVDAKDVTSLCWCAMQGLVVLRPKLELIDSIQDSPAVSVTERIDRIVNTLLNGIRNS